MPSMHSRLRRQYPYLTPQFVEEHPPDLLDRTRDPLDPRPTNKGLTPWSSNDEFRDPREKSLLRTMGDSIKPPDETKWLPTPPMSPAMPASIDPTNPDTHAARSQASGEIAAAESAKPLPRVHLGVSTKGLQGVDKSIAELQAARDYDKQGLGFKVTPEGVDMIPRDPHTDWKDRLKAGGKAALISIANIRKANPDASVAEMLAGGATGGGLGLAKPSLGNAIVQQAQLADMEQKLGPQIRLAQEGEQLEALRQRPQMEADKVRRDEEYRQAQLEIQRAREEGRLTSAEAQRKLDELRLKEQERHNREQERLGQERIDKPGKPEPDVTFGNSQLERNIAEAEAEKKTLGSPPPTEVDDVDTWGTVVGKKVNPAYVNWSARYRELDDQIRRWRADMKAPKVPSLTRGGVSEQQIRDAAKAKGLDPEQAVKRARSRGMIR